MLKFQITYLPENNKKIPKGHQTQKIEHTITQNGLTHTEKYFTHIINRGTNYLSGHQLQKIASKQKG